MHQNYALWIVNRSASCNSLGTTYRSVINVLNELIRTIRAFLLVSGLWIRTIRAFLLVSGLWRHTLMMSFTYYRMS